MSKASLRNLRNEERIEFCFLKNEKPDSLLQGKNKFTGKGKSFNRESRGTQPKTKQNNEQTKPKKTELTDRASVGGRCVHGGGKIRMMAAAAERHFPAWNHPLPQCSYPEAHSETMGILMLLAAC